MQNKMTSCLTAVIFFCGSIFSGKNKVKAGASEIAAAAAPDDDFDALMDAVKKADSVCSFAKCKASVLTLGQLCLFCNRQFCLSHHIPEVRGGRGLLEPLPANIGRRQGCVFPICVIFPISRRCTAAATRQSLTPA